MSGKPPADFAGRFTENVAAIMHGSGDDPQPINESVQLMEYMMLDFMTAILGDAQRMSRKTKRRMVRAGDLLFVLRKDKSKRNRAKRLLRLKAKINEERRRMGDLKM